MTTNNSENAIDSLESLSECVDQFDSIFKQLFRVVKDQIDAVIHSDIEMVVGLTEKHMELQKEYKIIEKVFIEELKNHLNPVDHEDGEIKLNTLKEVYPARAAWIDEVRQRLSNHTIRLAERQKQLTELLDFALVQNSKLMYSIFKNGRRERVHYGAGGDMNPAQSGVAINREV